MIICFQLPLFVVGSFKRQTMSYEILYSGNQMSTGHLTNPKPAIILMVDCSTTILRSSTD